MVSLRLLEPKDAAGMLEWMHDSQVNCFFRFDAEHMNREQAEQFIRQSVRDAANRKNYHYAIVDEQDSYLGTISLKDIDWKVKIAEYAISMKRDSQGKGYATSATKQLLEIAFEQLNLNRVFLNVLPENKRAIHLYEKCGFVYEGEFREHIYLRGKLKNLKWYGMLKEEYLLSGNGEE